MRLTLMAAAAHLLLLAGCKTDWVVVDLDGDGFAMSDGDCDEADASIHPDAAETWYDGVDQNCDGNDDDADGDGFVAVAAGGDDCWDDPASIPDGYAVATGTDSAGGSLGWAQPQPAEVHPDAVDTWYDGVDQDCSGNDDFDQDGDGYRSDGYPDQQGAYGDDCVDGASLDQTFYDDDDVAIDLDAVGVAATDIHPDQDETWYDGIDVDCDGWDDYDQDGDGYRVDSECDDEDAAVFPNDATDTWYDCLDSNCDGNDGDQDGDGYVPDDYAATCDWEQFAGHDGAEDCWDDPASTPTEYTALHGKEALDPEEVFPGADDRSYDGIDADCAGDSDFDDDGDGYDTTDLSNRDGDYGEDCDDADPLVSPGQNESCSTDYDDDCDGELNDVNASGCTIFYEDRDGDSYGTTTTRCYCEAFDVYTSDNPDDCVDTGDQSAVERDGLGTSAITIPPEDVNPGATELCNEVDDDCDGRIDDDDSSVSDPWVWYADDDSDDFGDPDDSTSQCFRPGTDVLDDTDCDDTRDWVYPEAQELCDDEDLDEDCDGLAENDDLADADSSTYTTFYVDADADTFGDQDDAGTELCDATAGTPVTDHTDCDDTRDHVYPDAQELCDDEDRDEDCDGLAENDDLADSTTASRTTFYPDADDDDYGDEDSFGSSLCDATDDYPLTDSTDCDDSRSDVNPGADEVCDASDVDEDCDGTSDDDDSSVLSSGFTTFYADADADTFGDAADSDDLCDASSAYPVTDATDCDDTRDHVYPDAQELCDDEDLDEDCDGLAENDDLADADASTYTTFFPDADADGYGDESSAGSALCDATASYPLTDSTDCDDSRDDVSPGDDEVCDASDTDEDCDGLADDDDSSTLTGGMSTWYPDTDDDGQGDAASAGNLQCDADATWELTDHSDCDDSRDDIYLGGQEVCDASDTDEDCDGTADNDDASALTSSKTTFYPDADSDTFGDEADAGSAFCDATSAYPVTDSTDCDDSRDDVNPDADEVCDASNTDEDCDGVADDDDSSTQNSGKSRWYPDDDSDGFGDDADSGSLQCDADATYTTTDNTDCDDGSSAINTDADEVCDGSDTDEDCDGLSDDDDPGVLSTGFTTYYEDADSDSFGDDSSAGSAQCDADATYELTDNSDCDDADSAIHPAAEEICDGSDTDEDCDGLSDDDDPGVLSSGFSTFYPDSDDDGFGNSSSTGSAQCDADATYEVLDATDCDDLDSAINTDADEVCDASDTDEDCDGLADDADASALAAGKTTWYTDGDSDAYGDDADAGTAYCDDPGGSATVQGDCDDGDAAVNPDADEVCDASDTDEDCDGLADDADPGVLASGKTSYYPDVDLDGYGDDTDAGTGYCDDPGGATTTDNTDCDDGDSGANPGETEVCDALDVDEDCDGLADDSDLQGASGQVTVYADSDGDGYGDDTDPGSATCDQGTASLSADDCDDSDPLVNPAAADNTIDGADQDCDGADGWTIAALSAGDLVITEIAKNPVGSDSSREWWEIYNASGADVDLDGLEVVDDDGDSMTVSGSTPLYDDTYFVFGVNDDTATNGGVTVDYEYLVGDLALANGPDELILLSGALEIDRVEYTEGEFPNVDGVGWNLDPSTLDATSNDTSTNWCSPYTIYNASGVDYGTPGSDNDNCYTHDVDLQPVWDTYCSGCHTGGGTSGNLDLDDAYSNIVLVGSDDFPSIDLVSPGDPANSYLWQKVQGTAATGLQMPRGGPYLSSVDPDAEQMIYDWILQGAEQ